MGGCRKSRREQKQRKKKIFNCGDGLLLLLDGQCSTSWDQPQQLQANTFAIYYYDLFQFRHNLMITSWHKFNLKQIIQALWGREKHRRNRGVYMNIWLIWFSNTLNTYDLDIDRLLILMNTYHDSFHTLSWVLAWPHWSMGLTPFDNCIECIEKFVPSPPLQCFVS